jgi:hypothetical protein
MKDEKPISSMNSINNIKLYIPDDIYQKIMFWVDKSNHEVSWWGLLEYEKENNFFIVRDVFLLKQKVGAASTEIDANAMNKLMFQVKDSPYKLRWWGHSHVKMNVFWSGTDIDTIKQFSQEGWLLSTVFNQKREMRTSYMIQNPITFFVDNIPTEVYSPAVAIPKEWEDEFEEKVVKQTMPTFTTSKNKKSDDFADYEQLYEFYVNKQRSEEEKKTKPEEEDENIKDVNDEYFKMFNEKGELKEEYLSLYFEDEVCSGTN